MTLKLFLFSISAGIVIELIFQLLKFLDDNELGPPEPKYLPYNHYVSVTEFVASGHRNWFRYVIFRSLPPIGVLTFLAAIQQRYEIGGSLLLALMIGAVVSLLPRDAYKLFLLFKGSYSIFSEKIIHFANLLLVIGIASTIWAFSLIFNLGLLSPSLSGVVDNLWSSLFVVIIVTFYNSGARLPRYTPNQIKNNQVSNSVIESYRKIEERFGTEIKNVCEKYKCSEALLYAIIIYEDMNRPKYIRFVENLLVRFTGYELTVGIAQVKSKKPLSDEESIKQAAAILKGSKKAVDSIQTDYSQDHAVLVRFTNLYNQAVTYHGSIIRIMTILRKYAPNLFV